jgi:integrase
MNKSKSYVCKMAGLIRSAFAEAVENDICTKNPARKLKTPKVHEYPKHSFTKSETDIILNFARTYNQNIEHNELTKRAGLLIGSAVIVLLWTGLRRGELLGLKWSDIENNQLSVNRAVYLKKGEDGKYHPTVTEHEAKTYTSLRTIPLPPEASEAINRLPRIGVYIFGSETGKLMHPRNFNRAYESFGKNLRTAHPEVRKLCPHECRHTFATLTQKAGGSMRTVQVMLGHARIETTARYTHPDFSAMETVIDEYSKMLGRSAE